MILANEGNFKNLIAALTELQAECIAIPEFKAEYLHRGHAVRSAETEHWITSHEAERVLVCRHNHLSMA